jgi:hypothetical protein
MGRWTATANAVAFFYAVICTGKTAVEIAATPLTIIPPIDHIFQIDHIQI